VQGRDSSVGALLSGGRMPRFEHASAFDKRSAQVKARGHFAAQGSLNLSKKFFALLGMADLPLTHSAHEG